MSRLKVSDTTFVATTGLGCLSKHGMTENRLISSCNILIKLGNILRATKCHFIWTHNLQSESQMLYRNLISIQRNILTSSINISLHPLILAFISTTTSYLTDYDLRSKTRQVSKISDFSIRVFIRLIILVLLWVW